MKYEVNAKGFVTEIIINIQEIGKESVDVNGTQSGIYYQLTYTITPDGNIKVKRVDTTSCHSNRKESGVSKFNILKHRSLFITDMP